MLKGLQDYTESIGLISRLGLWKYFTVPIIISVDVATLIGGSAYGFSDDMGTWISGIWGWEWGKSTFSTFSTIISAIIIIALGLILFKHIIMALSAPFMSPVSEKIEAHLRGTSQIASHRSSFMSQLWRGIRINGRNLFMELLITIPILFLKFIPVINIFSTALLFILQAYFAGFGNMDYTLERHLSYKESINFVRKNRALAIGNGAGFLLLLIIPLVGVILVLPFSVTAASVSTVRRLYPEEAIS
jgi:CysZ protein